MKTKETFIEELKILLQKAMKNNLLNSAIKIQEMIGKCNGFFQQKNNVVDLSNISIENLKLLLSQIKNHLKIKK